MCLCNVAICSLFIDDGQHLGLAYVSLQVVVGVMFLSLLTGDLLSGSFQLQGVVCLLNVFIDLCTDEFYKDFCMHSVPYCICIHVLLLYIL